MASIGPPRDWTRPLPSVTTRIWPPEWECHAVLAPGSKWTEILQAVRRRARLDDRFDPDVTREPVHRPSVRRLSRIDLHL